MKKVFIASFLFLFPIFISAQDYKLMWEDNFDNPVLNETQHWTVEVNGNGGGNNEMQYYRRENISIEQHSSGVNCLVISAKRESFGGKVCTSGRLVTRGNVSAKYGKIEARIKLPSTANGLWPAFWMMGEDFPTVGWPRCGETDILEMGNVNGISKGTQDRYFNGACHWGENWTYYAKDNTATYSLQDDFHLFTLIWDENNMKMYVDLDKYPGNLPYFEMSIAGERIPGQVSNYFHKPFGILFNLAVGGNFTGITGNANINKINALPIDGTAAKMYIDYVRIYQKGIAGEEFHGPSIITDNEIPTLFTASKGTVTPNSIELLLNAADNSGNVFYEITYGTSSVMVNGTSGIQKSYTITGLNPSTLYNFSIIAKDANANMATNNPIIISATTNALSVVTEPTNPAPTPTVDPSNVISMFSNTFTNVGVDTWKTVWSSLGSLTDLQIGGNDTKKYFNLGHVGIETTGANYIDVTNMNYFHVDVWTPNITKLYIKLVDFGANAAWSGGDDVEHELTFTPIQSTWNSYNLALSDFTGLTTRQHFAQLIFKGDPYSTGILYIDNVYFSKTSTGILDVNEESGISYYPNPVINNLIVTSKSKISKIVIANLLGQTILIFKPDNKETELNLSSLSGGNYLISIKLDDGKQVTKKVVKF